MTKRMVMDVESVGLHGEAFAVGYVVIDEMGEEVGGALYACSPAAARGTVVSHTWVAENIPHLGDECSSPAEVRAKFWEDFKFWNEDNDLEVWADCGWPVEARFLIACIEDDHRWREWSGPYLLHEIASVMLAAKKDPLGTYERMVDETPAHDPLKDARQSARLLYEALNEQR